MVLFRRQRKSFHASQRLELELEVTELSWSLEKGSISYRFRALLPAAGDAVLALNRGLEAKHVEGASTYKVKRSVESDLRWATLTLLILKGAERSVSGFVEGVPEDFTLSRLGVRYGRAVLSSELVWHPVLGRGLATWGTRGHVRRYVIHVASGKGNVVGPGTLSDTEQGPVFEGEPRLRNPGVTVIGGVHWQEREGMRVATARPEKVGFQEARSMLETLNKAFGEVGELLEAPAPRYRVAALVWDDIEPFACDDMLALRLSVARALARGNQLALYEAVYTASVHMVYNSPLESIRDYWLYETLPGVLSLYVLATGFGGEAVEAARSRLSQCVEAAGGSRKLPAPASISVPKNPRQHASVSCLAPLLLWNTVGARNLETLGSLVGCILKRGSVSESSFEACVEELVGSMAARVMGVLRKGIQ
jgi:hypothetical protein